MYKTEKFSYQMERNRKWVMMCIFWRVSSIGWWVLLSIWLSLWPSVYPGDSGPLQCLQPCWTLLYATQTLIYYCCFFDNKPYGCLVTKAHTLIAEIKARVDLHVLSSFFNPLATFSFSCQGTDVEFLIRKKTWIPQEYGTSASKSNMRTKFLMFD